MKRIATLAVLASILTLALPSVTKAQFGYGFGSLGPGFGPGIGGFGPGVGLGYGPRVGTGFGTSVGFYTGPAVGFNSVGYRGDFYSHPGAWNRGAYYAPRSVVAVPVRSLHYGPSFGRRCW